MKVVHQVRVPEDPDLHAQSPYGQDTRDQSRDEEKSRDELPPGFSVHGVFKLGGLVGGGDDHAVIFNQRVVEWRRVVWGCQEWPLFIIVETAAAVAAADARCRRGGLAMVGERRAAASSVINPEILQDGRHFVCCCGRGL